MSKNHEQLQQELNDVEQRFLTLPGSLELLERQALWPELARLVSV